ncbi:uncharacterized protein LOC132700096 [Cylas formicarius]|uniref:uncharacterized protein LOC132700096 n=1 Tax=Cylas formicarius TaxID=197179 RepID=UPI0029587A6F|nr:uncharacterized protein LOC132700096 [Cylas formicarius]
MSKDPKADCVCLKASFRVFANLAGRLLRELLDVAYKMCFFCRRGCARGNRRIDQDDDVASAIGSIGGSTVDEGFYKEVTRETAEKMLENTQNGTFIMRPSRCGELATLSVVQDTKVFHLGVRRRRADGLVALGTEKFNEKCFKNVNGMINYYVSNYLVLYSDGKKTLTLLLPYRDNGRRRGAEF